MSHCRAKAFPVPSTALCLMHTKVSLSRSNLAHSLLPLYCYFINPLPTYLASPLPHMQVNYVGLTHNVYFIQKILSALSHKSTRKWHTDTIITSTTKKITHF